eukprot:comp22453_c0_seq1/m.55237 comp22453_c0_seq1/g.55237  ORF comp22453_c0_seq1/g.55237 comp22453_c0_seq1/m.55237 type:complete len:368 (-) comp22453_c0_seq1:2499-3602(-)
MRCQACQVLGLPGRRPQGLQRLLWKGPDPDHALRRILGARRLLHGRALGRRLPVEQRQLHPGHCQGPRGPCICNHLEPEPRIRHRRQGRQAPHLGHPVQPRQDPRHQQNNNVRRRPALRPRHRVAPREPDHLSRLRNKRHPHDPGEGQLRRNPHHGPLRGRGLGARHPSRVGNVRHRKRRQNSPRLGHADPQAHRRPEHRPRSPLHRLLPRRPPACTRPRQRRIHGPRRHEPPGGVQGKGPQGGHPRDQVLPRRPPSCRRLPRQLCRCLRRLCGLQARRRCQGPLLLHHPSRLDQGRSLLQNKLGRLRDPLLGQQRQAPDRRAQGRRLAHQHMCSRKGHQGHLVQGRRQDRHQHHRPHPCRPASRHG